MHVSGLVKNIALCMFEGYMSQPAELRKTIRTAPTSVRLRTEKYFLLQYLVKFIFSGYFEHFVLVDHDHQIDLKTNNVVCIFLTDSLKPSSA